MNTTALLRSLIIAAPVLFTGTTAVAGGRCERRTNVEFRYESFDGAPCEPRCVTRCESHCRADVDFDKLDAKLRCACDTWNLRVRYKIDIEDARRAGPLDLVLEFRDCGRPVLGDNGEPISFVVPLNCPSDVDDDDLKFKGCFQTRLPRGLFCRPKKADLIAYVVTREDGRPIDRAKRHRIDVDD